MKGDMKQKFQAKGIQEGHKWLWQMSTEVLHRANNSKHGVGAISEET